MNDNKNDKDRRKFLKNLIGIGTVLWLTPAIISVSADKGHAQLSGGNVLEGSGSGQPGTGRRRKSPQRIRPKDYYF